MLETFKNGAGLFGLRDSKTKTVVVKPTFKYLGEPHDGLVVADNGKNFGALDAETGRMRIPFKYISISDFSNGVATANFDHFKYVLIDKTGKHVSKEYGLMLPYSNGFAAVLINGKFGFIDKKDKMIISPKFDNAWCFNEYGLAYVEMYNDDDCTAHYITPGEYVLPAIPGRPNLSKEQYGRLFASDLYAVSVLAEENVDNFKNVYGAVSEALKNELVESLDACKTKEEMEEIKEVYDEKSRFLEACLDYNRDLRVLKENETALENIERENQ